MTSALVRQSWRLFLSARLRIAAALLLLLLPLVQQAATLGPAEEPRIVILSLACLVASVGSTEARLGLLRGVFARPVEVWRYVVARFVAAVALGAVLCAGFVIATQATAILGDHGIHPGAALRSLVEGTLMLAPIAAWCVALSPSLPDGGDVTLLVGLSLAVAAGAEFLAVFREPVLWTLRAAIELAVPHPRGTLLETLLVSLSASSLVLLAGIAALRTGGLPAEARA